MTGSMTVSLEPVVIFQMSKSSRMLIEFGGGREQIDSVLDNDDDVLLPSVHAYQLISSDGQSARVGCLVEIHGQLGPACYWHGLWPSREAFWNALGSEYGYWVTPLMGDVTDEAIFSHRRGPSRPKKRRSRTHAKTLGRRQLL
mgnify:CR=1 FL=1